MYKDYVKQNNKWDELAEKTYKLQELAKHYATLATESKKKLIELSGKQNSIGYRYALKAEPRKGVVEYTKIPELQFVDLDMYRKTPIISWKLEVAKKELEGMLGITL